MPLQHDGKTKRTRTFPKPQSASCLERKIKSKTEAAASAGEEKSLDRTPHYRPLIDKRYARGSASPGGKNRGDTFG
jgi:hypothetical protein